MNLKFLHMYLILTLCNNTNCVFYEYIKNVGTYFGYGKEEIGESINDEMLRHIIPYELPVSDEKFISEAARLTSVALSELDSCQHRVVLKLQTSCDKMNDEELAKLAVMLLNCQSAIEGRTIFPCTDTMTIKDCTTNMDSDTWNSYHLMSNRARAVCYSVRQSQFRGLTEYTINKLMTASRNQLFNLDKISKDQENLHEMAQHSLNLVAKGQEYLLQQQKDFQQTQLYSQLELENNILRLSEEKKLITETNEKLVKMTNSVQNRIEQATSQLKMHTDESRDNHQQLIDDLIAIQNKVQIIFQRIEDSSQLVLKQSKLARQQYKVTLQQLAEVNATVNSLVSLVKGTKKALEERLSWINTALGGTDLALERLHAVIWHIAFLLIAMISCSFLGAQILTRLIVVIALPLNLALTLQQSGHALDPENLCIAIGVCVIVQLFVSCVATVWQSKILRRTLSTINEKLSSEESANIDTNNYRNFTLKTSSDTYKDNSPSDRYRESLYNSTFTSSSLSNGHALSRSRSRTPSVLNGNTKNNCSGKTRMGTPCKLTALTGRQFCYRHQTGNSIYGD